MRVARMRTFRRCREARASVLVEESTQPRVDAHAVVHQHLDLFAHALRDLRLLRLPRVPLRHELGEDVATLCDAGCPCPLARLGAKEVIERGHAAGLPLLALLGSPALLVLFRLSVGRPRVVLGEQLLVRRLVPVLRMVERPLKLSSFLGLTAGRNPACRQPLLELLGFAACRRAAFHLAPAAPTRHLADGEREREPIVALVVV
mmetsp:Transcript_6420/g.14850  ORF Transcript_6420/g.14850 Transcript_6420/m.14850 type:complete len:204 (-) Transcript_6420:93-704(-)